MAFSGAEQPARIVDLGKNLLAGDPGRKQRCRPALDNMFRA
jgi:hypothetical protein